MEPLSLIPDNRETFISSHQRQEGEFPTTRFIAVFEYTDCTREYDGNKWTIVRDKRQ